MTRSPLNYFLIGMSIGMLLAVALGYRGLVHSSLLLFSAAVIILTTQHSWTKVFPSACNGAILCATLSSVYVIVGICDGRCGYYAWPYYYFIAITFPIGFVLGALVGSSNHKSRKAALDKQASTMPIKEKIVNGLTSSAPNQRLWAAKKARETAGFDLESVRHILEDIAANDINDDVRHEAKKSLVMFQKTIA